MMLLGPQINYMPDKSHVIITVITTPGQIVQNLEHLIDHSFSRAKHLHPAKRNDFKRAVHYLAARSDDNAF